MKTLVIYHRADFDGLFCREIARKFLGNEDVEYVGWDYGDAVPALPPVTNGRNDGVKIYMLDLCIPELLSHWNLVWIDHHKSAIEKYATDITGYRIDGVAACRLAWQWFTYKQGAGTCTSDFGFPQKQDYVDRLVKEPLAVRLAGEYDVWDKRDPRAELFQHGLRGAERDFAWLLAGDGTDEAYVKSILDEGRPVQYAATQQNAEIVKNLGFIVEFEGLKFLALNSATKGSLQFAAKDVPETGHDALLKFNFTGTQWDVSLYHAKHRTDLDLSKIALAYGGGGHRGACGFRVRNLQGIIKT